MMSANQYPPGKARGNFVWLYLIFLVGLSAVMTWPLVTGLSRLVVNEGDPLFISWVMAWDCRMLASYPAELFHAPIFYPNRWSLAFSEHTLGNALMVFPFWCAGAGPILLHNLALMLTFVLSGFFMFLLVRRLTGDDRAAALCGVFYAFSHYRFGQLGNLPLLSMEGLPLFLLGLHLIFTRGAWRDFALGMAGFLMLALTIHYYTYMALVAGLLFLVWHLVQQRGRLELRLIRRALAASLVLIVLMTPLLVPYLKVRSEYGFRRETAETGFYSARPSSYLAAPSSNRLLGSITKPFTRKEGVLFPGILVLGLAGCAAAYPRGSNMASARSYYVLLAIMAGWCSLGPNPPGPIPSLYAVLQAGLPGFDGMRVPARFGMLVVTALTVLAGYGAAALLGRMQNRRAAFATCACLLLAVSETWCVPHAFRDAPTHPDEVNQWLAEQPGDAPVLFLPVFTSTRSYYETRRMISATSHWRPMVNGYSGFSPPGFDDLAVRLNRYPDKEAVALVQELGIRYVVFEWRYYDAQERADILARRPDSVANTVDFSEASAWEVLGEK